MTIAAAVSGYPTLTPVGACAGITLHPSRALSGHGAMQVLICCPPSITSIDGHHGESACP